jgi:hypothetical protein
MEYWTGGMLEQWNTGMVGYLVPPEIGFVLHISLSKAPALALAGPNWLRFAHFAARGPEVAGQIGFVLHNRPPGPAGKLPEIGFVLHISPSAVPRWQAKLGSFCIISLPGTLPARAHFRALRSNWLCFARWHLPEIGFVLHNRSCRHLHPRPKLGSFRTFRSPGPGSFATLARLGLFVRPTTGYRLPTTAVWLCFARIFTTGAQSPQSWDRPIPCYELGIFSVISVGATHASPVQLRLAGEQTSTQFTDEGRPAESLTPRVVVATAGGRTLL